MNEYDHEGRPISRPSGPPQQRPKRIPFWLVPPGDPSVMCVLQSEITAVHTHFDREIKQTLFCTADKHGVGCWHTDCARQQNYSAYALVEVMSPRRLHAIWHITSGCVSLYPALDDRSRSLLGARVTARRQGLTVRAPMIVQSLEYGLYARTAPPHWDCLEHLMRVYVPRRGERTTGKSPPASE